MVSEKSFPLLVVVAAGLSACGLAQQVQLQQQEATARPIHDSARGECERLFPDRLKRPVVSRVRCLNSADEAYYAMAAPRDIDLIRLALAQRLVAAERFDQKQLSEGEYEAASATIFADLQTQARQRDQIALQNHQAQQAASAAMIASGAAMMTPPPPPPPPAPPRFPTNTNCTTTGATTNCQSW